MYSTLADLREGLRTAHIKETPEWRKKMLHAVPDLPYVADRAKYLVEKCTGEVVLDLGCASGSLSKAIRKVAKGYRGIDKAPGGDWTVYDLDRVVPEFPVFSDVTLILIAELLEHLDKPGLLLDNLMSFYTQVPVWITVPQAGAYQLRDGTYEMVNPDHVCWYSYTTLKTLLGRYGYAIDTARWYGGRPTLPEGLIVKAV